MTETSNTGKNLSKKITAEKEGASIMVSAFLCSCHRRLRWILQQRKFGPADATNAGFVNSCARLSCPGGIR